MSTNRDTTRIVRSWLRTDEHDSADRVLDAVFDRLDTTPQRRPSWLARRIPIMNNTIRLIAAAAAVVVVALIGYQLLVAPNVGGPPPAPSPSESPSIAPTVTPAPSEGSGNVFPPAGPLEAGTRYAVTLFELPADTPVSFSFVVPTSGWSGNGEGFFAGHPGSAQSIELAFSNLDNRIPGVFPDPCVHENLQVYEASVSGWADALTSIPGTELVSGRGGVTIAGRPGQAWVIAIPDDVGCPRDEFWLSFAADCALTEPCYQYPTRLGENIHEWVVDTDGTLFSIQAQVHRPDLYPEAAAELQQILDSIQFE